MKSKKDNYYEEILILVDGWPYNLSEFDFRRWFAPGSWPMAIEPLDLQKKKRVQALARAVSENRIRKSTKRAKSRRSKRAA